MPPRLENDSGRLPGRPAVQSHDQKNTARIPRLSDTSTGPKLDALRQLIEVIDLTEALRAAAVVDAIRGAYAATWTRRADDFAAVGNEESDQIALECRRHAWLIAELAGEPWPGAAEDYRAVMAERDQLATVAEGVAA